MIWSVLSRNNNVVVIVVVVVENVFFDRDYGYETRWPIVSICFLNWIF